jgi:hypothetical protein
VLQVGGAKIDASVFRLNCSATVVMLFTLSATVFGRQYVGNPIDCIHNRWTASLMPSHRFTDLVRHFHD